jgi:TnpA family transposase
MPAVIRRIHSKYLGEKAFPKEITEFEIWEFFTLSAADLRAMRVDSNKKSRLALALQVGFLRMTGAVLDTYDYIPRPVLECVAKQLHVPAPMLATMRALSRRPMTRHGHQSWACRYLGISRLRAADEPALFSALTAEMSVTVDREQLVLRAHEIFWNHRWRIPSRRAVEQTVREAMGRVEAMDMEALRLALPSEDLKQLHVRLVETQIDGVSALEWIRRPTSKRGAKSRALAITKLNYLRTTFTSVASCEIAIPPERLRAYARRLYRRRVDHAKEISQPGRTLEVVGFLHTMLGRQADRVLRMMVMAVARIWRNAHERAASRVRDGMLANNTLIEDLCREVLNKSLTDTAYRKYAQKRLQSWTENRGSRNETRAAQTRAVLLDKEKRIRALIKQIIAVGLEGPPADPVLKALNCLRDTYNLEQPALSDGAKLDFSKIWQPLVDDPDRSKALRAYEAATLWAVRRGLRAGRLFLPYAEEYRGKERLLMPEPVWDSTRDAFLDRRQLPAEPEPFLDRVVAQVEAGMQALDEAVSAHAIFVNKNGIHLKLDDDPRVTVESNVTEALRKRLVAATKDRVGTVQLPELMLAMDSETGFSHQLLGRPPRSADELISSYAGVLAAAANVEASAMALMVPGLAAPAISRVLRLLEGEPALRRASDAVVEWMRALPLVKGWGRGFEASADMVSLDTSRHVYLARQDPRRRRFAVGSYLHILKEWGIVYDQPLPLMTRQVGAAIDGRMRQVITELSRVSVDTHGYTDMGMTCSKLAGFDLCPRVHNMADRKLHVLRGMKIPESIADHVLEDVSLNSVREHWSALLRLVATFEGGWTSATQLLGFYGSAARGEGLYLAGSSLGKLLRTIYLCDYYTLPEFRHEIYRTLERGESVHALQRAIHIGTIPVRRGRDLAEFGVVSGALALMTNIVMAYNAGQLQKSVDAAVANGIELSECIKALAHVGPVSYGHINFRGTYAFPIDRYAARILRAAA